MSKERNDRYIIPMHATGIIMTLGLAYWALVPRSPPRAVPETVSVEPDTAASAAGDAVGQWFRKGPVRLDLEFKGLIENDNQRVVLVSLNGQQAQSFKLGQERPPGLALQSVKTDHAIFTYQGRRISVPFPATRPAGDAGLIERRQ
ncbi:MAG: hypothetical protein ACN6OC_00330 [Alcaligenes sp.]